MIALQLREGALRDRRLFAVRRRVPHARILQKGGVRMYGCAWHTFRLGRLFTRGVALTFSGLLQCAPTPFFFRWMHADIHTHGFFSLYSSTACWAHSSEL
ncbi:hypothetical protein DQ04_05071010 [Trypanosoma grayi]|uniref:hypothetical protein n=1 Tax=Trypanosoma grayi TaxID=71804 RepID=UPI0004F3FAF9|nr:hypothetical protein DQ04_05071010 [Trypanosoma grayi]KEG09530.1 hypothetical protein DQ04_05071010 [Trypanosoma grayi]